MSILELLILSVSLAMDATAVALACSVSHSKALKRQLLKAAFLFGFFQALMPLIGFYLGSSVKGWISNYDHWIAFVLLSIVGLKLALEKDEAESDAIFSNKNLIVMAVATSIDALIVGITFSFVKVSLAQSILTIGIITFVMSLSAGLFGKTLSKFDSKYLKIAGGVAIIVIGVKILLSHLI